jgi:hypothetical protein
MWFLGEVIDGMLPKIEFLNKDGMPESINVLMTARMKSGQPPLSPFSKDKKTIVPD